MERGAGAAAPGVLPAGRVRAGLPAAELRGAPARAPASGPAPLPAPDSRGAGSVLPPAAPDVRGDAGEPRFSELARGSGPVTALLEVCSSAMRVRATTGRVGGQVTLGRAVRGDVIALAAGAASESSTTTGTGTFSVVARGSSATWLAATGIGAICGGGCVCTECSVCVDSISSGGSVADADSGCTDS